MKLIDSTSNVFGLLIYKLLSLLDLTKEEEDARPEVKKALRN